MKQEELLQIKFKIDGVVIENEKNMFFLKDFKNILKLSYGKKKHFLIKII